MADVRDFGAVGDGIQDDTAAIQHAVDDGDGVVEFGRGNYRISKTIVVQSKSCGRIAICGKGGTAKIMMWGEGPAISLEGTHGSTADPAGFRPEEWQKERMPTVRDVEIEGRNPNADGIKINGVMQPTLTGLLVREVRHAVHITGRARNLVIDHCHFYHNTGVGVFLEEVNLHQSIIADSHISYCRLGGIRIEDSEIRNLQITGNDIEYNNVRSHKDLDDEPSADIYIDVGEKGTVREGTISSNTIQATYSQNGSNIRIIGSDQNRLGKKAGSVMPIVNHRAGMWTISGNLIGSQDNNVHLTNVRGVVMTGNYVYSGHHRNVLIQGSRNIVIGSNCMGHNPDYRKNELATGIRLENCEGCNVSGLLIEDAEAGKHTVPNTVPIKREALIEIMNCRRVSLSGVQVLDPTPVGIRLHQCQDTVLTGCTVIDDRIPQKMTMPILWTGEGTGNMITGCRMGKGSEGDMKIPETVQVIGNA
ncbi:right-handed parallel beta-helix repeat-containing protein [Pirellulaceae bacterium]|jgi:hypothetical protein|nr:right-handed parallel beta-helix repeat-containing protein [Pirellulaceae bacterium]